MPSNENKSESSPSDTESDLASSGDDRWRKREPLSPKKQAQPQKVDSSEARKKRSRSDSPVSSKSKKAKVSDKGDGTSGPKLLPGVPKILLVLDTNILLEQAGLGFLQQLSQGYYDVDDLPLIQIMVPQIIFSGQPYRSHKTLREMMENRNRAADHPLQWQKEKGHPSQRLVVFVELDRQKTRHFNGLSQKSSAAIRFLKDQMADGISAPTSSDPVPSTSFNPPLEKDQPCPRFLGQTARDYAQAGKDFQQEIDDDHVMFCCLQMQARKGQPGVPNVVWCLTNDRNLRTRTVINGLPAYSLAVLLQNLDKKRQGESSIFDSLSR